MDPEIFRDHGRVYARGFRGWSPGPAGLRGSWEASARWLLSPSCPARGARPVQSVQMGCDSPPVGACGAVLDALTPARASLRCSVFVHRTDVRSAHETLRSIR